MYDNGYIKKMIEKINDIEDSELKEFVLNIIHERTDLIKNINIDYLTGLNNRRALDYVEKFKIVVMCDIDNFKGINDVYGHDTGDRALKLVASVLSKNTRNNDIVCRYGGDEFLIIFNDCDVNVVFNRMLKIQKELYKLSKELNTMINISVGISETSGNETLTELITEADKALYESKNSGKDIVTIHDRSKSKLKK